MREVTIRLKIEPLPDGGEFGNYMATSPDVPGLLAVGKTIAETVDYAQDVARAIAETCVEHGDPLPPALAAAVEEGAIDLRVPVGIA